MPDLSSMGEEQIKAYAEAAAEEMSRLDRKANPSRYAEPEVPAAPFEDDMGRPYHYDLERHPPGSTIQSTAPSESRGHVVCRTKADGTTEWFVDDEERERIEAQWERNAQELRIAAKVSFLRSLRETKNPSPSLKARCDELEEEIKALGGDPDGQGALTRVVRATSAADKQLRTSNVDPFGRTIMCDTPEQLRREVERHGYEIARGAGER